LLLILVFFLVSPIATVSGRDQTDKEVGTLKLETQVVQWRLLEEDKHGIRFGLKLRLTFVNDGSEPLILLKQKFDIGAEMLARTGEEAKEGKYLFTFIHWPSVLGHPGFAKWRRDLDTQQPLPGQAWLLGRGHAVSVESETMIYIEKKGNSDRTNKPWDEIKQSPTLWLQVEVETWPMNLEIKREHENPEFGGSLLKRWKSYGTLQLGHIRSEPLEVTLPSS
jgi:hypothetical protein